jgi:hypothetical protein
VQIAGNDPNQAYSVSKTYITPLTQAATSSLLVLQAGNNHCGNAACNSPNNTLLTPLIAAWIAAELKGGGSTTAPAPSLGITTAPITIPALPTPNPTQTVGNAAFVTMSFPLSSVTPANPDLNGATFDIDVQQYVLPDSAAALTGTYRFRNPRINTPTNPLYVKDVEILINNEYNPATSTYTVIDTTVVPNANTKTFTSLMPTGEVADMFVPQQNAQGDQVIIAFSMLQKTSLPPVSVPCKNLAGFTANIYPYLMNTCFSCHKNGSGTSVYNMDDSNLANLCQVSLGFANVASPGTSILITAPRDQTNNHPVQIQNFPTQTFIDWISSE